ncbi:MAG: penicillin-insensitive murein endopeptidase [Deltaproteobacteria bacterium]|nr:penicillin-insensitive murein endopeptidase [Deltaproteobacteria bacterium]
MRVFAVVALLLSIGSVAEARPKRQKRVAIDAPAKRDREPIRNRDRSIGAPWSGRLQAPARLPRGEGYVLRRPNRVFGTRTTVEFVREAVTNTLEAFPKVHVLAIGDLSAESGGRITEHNSHQSGRDADLGLFFKKKPAGYPKSFARATAANLDAAATWKLVWELAKTSTQDGGAQIIFLDYDVQGILYRWAKANKVSEKRLDRVFQYPHGRDSANGVVRHYPNHENHLHVRFKCRDRDTNCR